MNEEFQVVEAAKQWTHLPDGRWIERVVWTNNGSAWVNPQTNRYVWDGQVLVAALNGWNQVQQSFTRGLDLSGTPQGAGGVGGLLWMRQGPAPQFACYDGNGNVMGLVRGGDGVETARYDYGPFGEVIRATGPMAKVNPMRFSTQYADDITGDRKYLHRDLDAATGRWPSRDPLNELGFKVLTERYEPINWNEEKNLYGFIGNNPLNRYDLFEVDPIL
jgi:RHS repeat-associated protein